MQVKSKASYFNQRFGIKHTLVQHESVLVEGNVDAVQIDVTIINSDQYIESKLPIYLAFIKDDSINESKVIYSADETAMKYTIINPDDSLDVTGTIVLDQDLFRINLSLYTISILIEKFGNNAYKIEYWVYDNISNTEVPKEQETKQEEE